MTFTIGSDYGYVIMTAGMIGFQIIITGGMISRIRGKLFSKEFFENNFPEFKGHYPRNGYPDMGSGRYSAKLSDSDWLTFNNYQRAHYNYVENVASILIFLLLSGLFYPRMSSLLGVFYIVGRFLYSLGYQTKGPRGRAIGSVFTNLSAVILFLMTMYGGFNHSGGLTGFKLLLSGK